MHREIPVEIDLGLLAVFDSNGIVESDYLYVFPLIRTREDWLKEGHRNDLEQSLLLNARDGIQLLINEIWQQPTRIADDGIVAQLPPTTTQLPREKPVSPLPILLESD